MGKWHESFGCNEGRSLGSEERMHAAQPSAPAHFPGVDRASSRATAAASGTGANIPPAPLDGPALDAAMVACNAVLELNCLRQPVDSSQSLENGTFPPCCVWGLGWEAKSWDSITRNGRKHYRHSRVHPLLSVAGQDSTLHKTKTWQLERERKATAALENEQQIGSEHMH